MNKEKILMSLEYTFIKDFFHLNEIKDYYELSDIENTFNSLSEDIKNDMKTVTDILYKNFKNKLEKIEHYTITLDGVSQIDGFNCYIQIYVNTNKNEGKNKIGLMVNNCNDYSNFDTFQNVIFYNLDVNCENNFKNHIFNILFFANLIIREYKYSPLFYNFYHKNDIIEMNNIRKRNIKLFGKNEECCVCYEQTVKKTSCDHPLCLKCLYKIPINNRRCPLCRTFISTDDEIEYDNMHTATIYVQRE